jgi:hypothetical protein
VADIAAQLHIERIFAVPSVEMHSEIVEKEEKNKKFSSEFSFFVRNFPLWNIAGIKAYIVVWRIKKRGMRTTWIHNYFHWSIFIVGEERKINESVHKTPWTQRMKEKKTPLLFLTITKENKRKKATQTFFNEAKRFPQLLQVLWKLFNLISTTRASNNKLLNKNNFGDDFWRHFSFWQLSHSTNYNDTMIFPMSAVWVWYNDTEVKKCRSSWQYFHSISNLFFA